jgi:hypothetical protein
MDPGEQLIANLDLDLNLEIVVDIGKNMLSNRYGMLKYN